MRKIVVGLGVVIAVFVGVALAADPDAVSREAWRVQVDANTNTVFTTTNTLYTASKAGSLLVGKTAGTNTIWIATAAGTNGWVRIAIGP